MEFSSCFNGFAKTYGFQEVIRGGGSSSNPSLVLDGERSELVKAMVRQGQKRNKAEKALAALRNHSEAERRRRERINGHLATLRSLIPGTDKDTGKNFGRIKKPGQQISFTNIAIVMQNPKRI